MSLTSNIVLPILQLIVIVGLAPLVKGLLIKLRHDSSAEGVRAYFSRYYNLVKLLRKDAVVSETTSWIFRATPYVTFVSILIKRY